MCPSLLPPYRIAPLTSTPIGNRVWPHHFHPLVHVSPTSLPIWSRAPQHFYPHWGRGLLLTSIAIGSGVWPRTSIPMCVCVCVCVPPLEVGAPPLLSPWSLTPHLYLHESATHFNPRVDSRPSLLSPLGGGGCPSLLSPCGVCAPYGIAPLTHTSWNMRAPHTCLLNPTSIAIWIVPLTSLYTKDGGQNVTWCLHGYLVKLRIMLRS